MKKSDLKVLRERMQQAVAPPSKKSPDSSDELASLFDDGTKLGGGGTGKTISVQENHGEPDSTQLDSTQLNSDATPISPTRDYNKRPNSIERDALPKRLFPGTSKKLYDALYLRTRGAVVPVRSLKATRTELMKWAGIGGLNTFLSHIKYLTKIGLIVRTFEVGDKEGAIYEVRIPEEIDLTSIDHSTQLNSARLNSTPPDSTQNLVHDSTQKLMRVESSNPIDNKGTYAIPKTSFKTNTEHDDDDAALGGLNSALKRVVKEITGKQLSAAESERWRELGELLAVELKIAAARTTAVSSVPSFLTEHLRRRLWKKDKKQLVAEAQSAQPTDAAPLSKEQLNKCPDCGGSGFYYPNGFEAGVARCRHERLFGESDKQSENLEEHPQTS